MFEYYYYYYVGIMVVVVRAWLGIWKRYPSFNKRKLHWACSMFYDTAALSFALACAIQNTPKPKTTANCHLNGPQYVHE